ncbi:TPA: hypothetical protein HA231_03725 [Candidatus Woesearchaeota archaeon]|nr:hypothetical protein [Candidatus Woesearchaeota archaeon]
MSDSEKPKDEPDQRTAEILKKDTDGFLKRQFSIIWDLWSFMKERKKWWLLPVIITIALVGLLIIFGTSSPLSPLIYTLF